MRQRSDFLDVLLRGSGPTIELLGAFALGLIVVGILSNLVYELLTHPVLGLWPILRSLLAVGALTFGAYLLYRLDGRRTFSLRATVDESQLARPCAGVVWMLGPGNFDHLLVALRHHQDHGGAQHCWLVMESNNEAVTSAYNGVLQRASESSLAMLFHPYYLSSLDTQASYEATATILERESAEEKLEASQIVCDITGGTKPLTAGMILAGLANGSPLEYVETDRDAQGKPIPGTARVIAVDVSFYITQSARGNGSNGI